MIYTFDIHGRPAPGGSKSFFPVWKAGGQLVTKIMNGRVWPIIRVVDAGGKSNELWKAACTIQARAFMQGKPPMRGALAVEFLFRITRPQSHYRTGKFASILRDDAPQHHVTTPDALKFARGTEDALTGVIWEDDAQNVTITSHKRYRLPTEYEGCAVTVRVL